MPITDQQQAMTEQPTLCHVSSSVKLKRVNAANQRFDFLVVSGKPIIISGLKDMIVDLGERVCFNASVRPGLSVRDISWFKDGVALYKHSRYSFTSNDSAVSLEISNCTKMDQATYKFTIKNNFGMASSKAKLILRGRRAPLAYFAILFELQLLSSVCLGVPGRLM